MTRPAPDDWALHASSLPLAFAQVREDPRLDVELVSTLPKHPVIAMIASGGETAVQIARCQPSALHLIDINPAQLALARLKLHLAEWCTPAEARAVLGYDVMESSTRRKLLSEKLHGLELAENALGPPELVADWGPDFSGRYERTFAQLQMELTPIRAEIETILKGKVASISGATPFDPQTEAGQVFDRAFNKVMSLNNLVCLFGTDATQNPRQSFAEHFARRTRECLSRPDRSQNPFLWQLLLGRFPESAPYDWLRPESAAQKPMPARTALHCGRMMDILQKFPTGSVDLVQLSNILDWLSPTQAAATLQAAYSVLRPGGLMILRQLNSTLDVPSLESKFRWDLSSGQRLVQIDRSYFYPKIFVGVRE